MLNTLAMTVVLALFLSPQQAAPGPEQFSGPVTTDSIYVVGEVVHPGTFQMRQGRSLSVSQAIALANGFTKAARPEKVEIIRYTSNGQHESTVVDARAVLTGAVPDVALNPNDVVFVPARINIRRVTDHWPILIAK